MKNEAKRARLSPRIVYSDVKAVKFEDLVKHLFDIAASSHCCASCIWNLVTLAIRKVFRCTRSGCWQ